jgi:hypothetical protein
MTTNTGQSGHERWRRVTKAYREFDAFLKTRNRFVLVVVVTTLVWGLFLLVKGLQ